MNGKLKIASAKDCIFAVIITLAYMFVMTYHFFLAKEPPKPLPDYRMEFIVATLAGIVVITIGFIFKEKILHWSKRPLKYFWTIVSHPIHPVVAYRRQKELFDIDDRPLLREFTYQNQQIKVRLINRSQVMFFLDTPHFTNIQNGQPVSVGIQNTQITVPPHSSIFWTGFSFNETLMNQDIRFDFHSATGEAFSTNSMRIST